MSALEEISKRQIKELLSKGWMTHDAMWFVSAYRQVGIQEANQLNLSAIALMSPFEVDRIRKAIGMEGVAIDTFDKLRRFLEDTLDLILPAFMQAEFSFPRQDVAHWKWKEGQCFAYKGLKRIGALDDYRCGVMYRIECWLRALDVRYTFEPAVEGCLMHERGDCSGNILFDFS